jgi:multimeric flavodoxin WrbA
MGLESVTGDVVSEEGVKMTKVLAINGSYREGGMTDQAVEALSEALGAAGADVEIVLLREYPVEFCLNCRACTQMPGAAPVECVQHDGMQKLIDKIERADSFILAVPTNFGSVTAIFKRFMERLVGYAHWPWHMNGPQYRKKQSAKKKALLVSSSAAPAILGRWFFGTDKQLKMTAKVLGAEVVGTLYTGMIAKDQRPQLSESARTKIRSLAGRLI